MIPQRHSKEHLKAEGREMQKEERCDASCLFFFVPFPFQRREGLEEILN